MQLLTKQLLTAAADAQFLDIISINLWNILISLLNLAVLFWLVKKFLFKPVRRMLDERQAAIDHSYAAAAEAQRIADESRESWESKLRTADDEAQTVIREAAEVAGRRAEQIVREADEKAQGMLRRAENEVQLERRRATEDMKREIVEVSAAIAEKMLEREVNENDHRAMIDDFIEKIGDGHEADQ